MPREIRNEFRNPRAGMSVAEGRLNRSTTYGKKPNLSAAIRRRVAYDRRHQGQ